jgi:hypothetical protein
MGVHVGILYLTHESRDDTMEDRSFVMEFLSTFTDTFLSGTPVSEGDKENENTDTEDRRLSSQVESS